MSSAICDSALRFTAPVEYRTVYDSRYNHSELRRPPSLSHPTPASLGGCAASSLLDIAAEMRGTRKTLLATGAIGVLSIGLWGVTASRRGSASREGISSERATLIRLVGSAYPGEARLVGFSVPGQSNVPPRLSRKALRLVRELSKDLERSGEQGQALADLAVLRFLLGRSQEAVDQFRAAARKLPSDARIQSDLSAAYLELARRKRQPTYVLEAFQAADRAVRLDPRLSAAQFNLALATERLFLRTAAQKLWKSYVASDSTSSWAEVARSHWFALSRPTPLELWQEQRQQLASAAFRGDEAIVARLVAIHPQRARLVAQESLLADWGRQELAGRQQAAIRTLVVVRAVGGALAAAPGGDATVLDVFTAIERSAPNSRARAALATAHTQYSEGVAAYRRGRTSEARRLLRASETGFAVAGSPMQLWARFDLARCDYQRAQYPPVLASLRKLLQEFDPARYPALAARVEHTIGVVLAIQQDFNGSLKAYLRALELAKRCNEKQSVAALHGLLAEDFRLIGEVARSWSHLHHALRHRHSVDEPDRLQLLLEEATQQALGRDLPRLALLFQSEALEVVRETGNPSAAALAHHRRASIHESLGDFSASRRDLEAARRFLDRVEDRPMRELLRGNYLLAAARLKRRAAPDEALPLLDQARDAFRAASYPHALPELLLERARTHLAKGSEVLATRDLERAILEIETVRKAVPAGDLRAAYLNMVQQLFDEMIVLQARRGRAATALEYAESARARLLLELVSSSQDGRDPARSMGPPSLAELQRTVPQGVSLVVYSAHDDLLLAWAFSRQSLAYHPIPLRPGELENRVKDLRDAIWEGSPRAVASSEELYRLLIQPLAEDLEAAETLVFVPDKVLHLVPFAALRNPQTGRYLVEEWASAVSPSVSLYGRSVFRLQELAHDTDGGALLIGDPAFDPELWPWLERLPTARREVGQLAALWPTSQVLVGADATDRSFLNLAGRSRYIHLASHAIVNREFPLRSGFLLAPSRSGAKGVVTTQDLHRMQFERTEVVFLAACGTADGALWGREGVANLARPFLAGGVPAVIASLWPLGDAATSDVVQDYYRQLRQVSSPLAALRSAQLRALERSRRAPSSLRAWAGFAFIGASN